MALTGQRENFTGRKLSENNVEQIAVFRLFVRHRFVLALHKLSNNNVLELIIKVDI
jgi:hypothetical protein